MAEKTVTVEIYDAIGGPIKYDKNTQAGPTNAGKFLVDRCEQHRSTRTYRDWSNVRWGAPLKEEAGRLMVQIDGKWLPLSVFTDVTKAEIEEYHFELFGKREVPSNWVFNDFGHTTCKVFVDLNGNGKKDKNEKINGEFIHPTPDEEAASAQGKDFTEFLTQSNESHGCVHVRANDIDAMLDKGYLKKGSYVEYHKYTAIPPASWLVKEVGRGPYAFHFYPGEKKIIIRGWK